MQSLSPSLASVLVLLISASALADDAQRAPQSSQDVVILRDVMVPMRDGVRLATDLYLPAKNGKAVSEKLPALLMRIPYNKETWGPHIPAFFARHGYLAVAQDVRGRFKSEGDFFAFRDEPKDGYDTIEWLARHPACNGRVGMHGVSYMGWVQYEAATQHPPHLTTLIPHCGPINAYKYSMHVGGTCTLGLLKWHLEMAMTSKEAQRNPLIAKAIATMSTGDDFLNWAANVPWQRGQTPLSTAPKYEDAAFKFYFENYDYNDFWRAPGYAMDEYMDVFPDVPMLSVVGWYEVYPRSIVDSHQEMAKRGRKHQFLLAGP